ncbi:MAG: hypothetical protein Q4F85_01565 [Prevotella sp.]|nr:hypothetical protein [Prevotella sp.]
MNDEDSTYRDPQKSNREEAPFSCLLAEASTVARGVLESVQALAGTTYCKGVQINELYKFAVERNCWFENPDVFGIFTDRGSENEVYMSADSKTVYKLNDFRYADDNLNPFFERIKVHNFFFPDCAYSLVGFSRNRDSNVCAVLSQPFIYAKREATEEEIATTLIELGFLPCLNGEYYSNGVYDIFDATPNNVLMGVDGEIYFIDTIIYKSRDSNIELYKSLSPKYQ